MPINSDKKTVFKVIILVVLVLSVYLYLYTNVFDDKRVSPLYKARNDNFGSIFDFLKLMKQSEKKPGLSTIISPSKYSLTTIAMGSSTIQPMNVSELMRAYKLLLEKNESIPVLTLFSSWSDDAEKYIMHNLTSVNWLSLRPYVIPVIFTNESGVANECAKLGWEVFPIRVAALGGIPVLKFMYLDVMAAINSTFYAYANGDILFTNRLVETLISLAEIIDLQRPTLIVGKRTNVVNIKKGEGSSWKNITRIAKKRGKLFVEYAEDYFITQRTYPWKDIPEVVIGRTLYDNWLVLNARKSKHHVIDITQTSLAVHQTTSKGNRESHGHNDTEYNGNLLKKIYKSIQYSAGGTDCVEEKSVINHKRVIGLIHKKMAKRCNV